MRALGRVVNASHFERGKWRIEIELEPLVGFEEYEVRSVVGPEARVVVEPAPPEPRCGAVNGSATCSRRTGHKGPHEFKWPRVEDAAVSKAVEVVEKLDVTRIDLPTDSDLERAVGGSPQPATCGALFGDLDDAGGPLRRCSLRAGHIAEHG